MAITQFSGNGSKFLLTAVCRLPLDGHIWAVFKARISLGRCARLITANITEWLALLFVIYEVPNSMPGPGPCRPGQCSFVLLVKPSRQMTWYYVNILKTGDADLRFYVTAMQDGWYKSAFLTRACFPCTIHLIMQYIEPVSEWSCWRTFIESWPHSELNLGTALPLYRDRRFATLQRTLFIYLINKYISLSDICLTVHHWYK